MHAYFMFGRYSQESLKSISSKRTEEAVGIIESFNGQVTALYALLGQFDLVLIVNLPGNREALEASIALTRATGIDFITAPAIAVERFDEFIERDLKRQAKVTA